jgi:hypothetical protein
VRERHHLKFIFNSKELKKINKNYKRVGMNTLIKSVDFGNEKMYIELNSNKILTIPYSYTKKLKKASIRELQEYRLIANGIGIHFIKLDEDISLQGIFKDYGDEIKLFTPEKKAS